MMTVVKERNEVAPAYLDFLHLVSECVGVAGWRPHSRQLVFRQWQPGVDCLQPDTQELQSQD